MSPRVDMAVVLQDLRRLDQESAHLSPDERLHFLAQALHERNFFSSFHECIEMASLWMSSGLRDMDPERVMGAAIPSAPREAAIASVKGTNEEPRTSHQELIRGLIRMIVRQIEASCGWSERELVSVERDGVTQILELLELLRAEPEFFAYAVYALRELLDRVEAERRESLRQIRRGPGDEGAQSASTLVT